MNEIWIPLTEDAAAPARAPTDVDDALLDDAEVVVRGPHVWIVVEDPAAQRRSAALDEGHPPGGVRDPSLMGAPGAERG